LDLFYRDIQNPATQKRLAAEVERTSKQYIDTYASEADALYDKAITKLLRSTKDLYKQL